jgi:hypothetical protein
MGFLLLESLHTYSISSPSLGMIGGLIRLDVVSVRWMFAGFVFLVCEMLEIGEAICCSVCRRFENRWEVESS